MQQILDEGNNIGEWEIWQITNLNYIYIEAEKKLELGYKMYNSGFELETFVLFMQVTKFYDLILKNKQLIISNKRHIHFIKNIKKIVLIMEEIKPKLIKKYEKNTKNIENIEDNNDDLFKVNLEDSTDEIFDNLESRWKKLASNINKF